MRGCAAIKPARWTACFCVTLAALLTGCEDAAKKPVQAHVPALMQQQASQPAKAQTVDALPLRNLAAQPLVDLQQPLPGGIDYLIQRVKEKFASGEANYK